MNWMCDFLDARYAILKWHMTEHRDEQTDGETGVLTDRDLGRTDERSFKSIWHRKQRWQKVSQEANLAHKINDIKA